MTKPLYLNFLHSYALYSWLNFDMSWILHKQLNFNGFWFLYQNLHASGWGSELRMDYSNLPTQTRTWALASPSLQPYTTTLERNIFLKRTLQDTSTDELITSNTYHDISLIMEAFPSVQLHNWDWMMDRSMQSHFDQKYLLEI